MLLGIFSRSPEGFEGTLRTLSITTPLALFEIQEPTTKGPHFRALAAGIEVGAGWRRTAQDSGKEYISLKLDDPSFHQPIYSNLIESDGCWRLVWQRRD